MQLALWEEYADEVEEQMRVLLADNALLQAALADVRSSLSHERPNSAGASGAHLLQGCPGDADLRFPFWRLVVPTSLPDCAHCHPSREPVKVRYWK